jgi:hypothetical protein
MALRDCPECHAQMSTTADSCPKCGWKPPRKCPQCQGTDIYQQAKPKLFRRESLIKCCNKKCQHSWLGMW